MLVQARKSVRGKNASKEGDWLVVCKGQALVDVNLRASFQTERLRLLLIRNSRGNRQDLFRRKTPGGAQVLVEPDPPADWIIGRSGRYEDSRASTGMDEAFLAKCAKRSPYRVAVYPETGGEFGLRRQLLTDLVVSLGNFRRKG